MIGLESVKDQFMQVLALAEYRAEARSRGIPGVENTTTNLVFEGNSGTGKTEVAELFAQALFEAGVVPGDENGNYVFVNTAPDAIKGEALGVTEKKMTDAFDAARGGVLFIDEAHNWANEDDAFAVSALTTLMRLAENHRDEVLVILGGYQHLRDDLKDVDEGLPRRFPTKISFPDYTETEKQKIGRKMFTDKSFTFSPAARRAYDEAVASIPGNAGHVRNFNEQVETAVGLRYRNAKVKDRFKMHHITPKDVEFAIAHFRDDMGNPITVQPKSAPAKKAPAKRAAKEPVAAGRP